MNPTLRGKLAALGAELSPAMVQGTGALMAGIAAARDPAVEIERDCRYGPDERNRLDVFRIGRLANAPVVAYVHGGGYVMGDKTSPGSPFYDNFGQWAAQQGYVGVTLTYRLAPRHRWPSGPQDMAHAVQWLRTHVAGYGGDPSAIFLVGQSAGAAHVAAYLAHTQFHHAGSPDIAGAVMISGIYDAMRQPPSPFSAAYYGDDPAARSAGLHLDGLLASQVPMLFTVSEFDPRDFQTQAAQLVAAWQAHKGQYAPVQYLAGHNHLSPAQSIGSAEDFVARCLAAFVAINRP